MTASVGTIAQQSLRRLGVRVVPLDDSPTLTEMVPASAIATAALVELGVIASDETPSATDQALMVDKVASVHASLDAQGVVWWSGDAIPRAFTEEYTKLTAAMSASSFGKSVDPAVVALLEGRVRKGAMVLSADDNAQQAVQAVHDDLVMRGIARWTTWDIPEAVGDAYAVLAADRLAPLFGMDTDAKDTALAMVSIYRFVALPTSGETVAAAYF
jgi:hypothetical protein